MMEKVMQSKEIGIKIKQNAIFMVLLAVIIIFSVLSEKFFTLDNLLTLTRQVAMLGIASIGMMFVMISGGIDLSVGSMITLANIVCAYFMVELGWNPVLAVVICMLIAAGIGSFQGLMVAKVGMPPLIITLAFMNILKGIAFVISGGLPINGFDPSFKMLGQGYIGVLPIPIILMVIVFIVGGVILSKFSFGRYIYAIGGNEEASKLSGINVDFTKIIVYMLCGFFAALAGIVFLSRLNSGSPTTGSGFEMDVITAVVLGGVSVAGGSGRIPGVIAGVLILGILDNGLILVGVTEYWQWIIKGIILAVAVGFDCLQKKNKK
jgi:ribose transport system permease protein